MSGRKELLEMGSSLFSATGVPSIQTLLSFLEPHQWFVITMLGDGAFPLLLFIGACALQRTNFALTIGLLGTVTGILIGLLKQTIQEPRPYLVNSDVSLHHISSGFGMPSGHSATVFITFFVLCAFARRKWLWPVFASTIIAVGLSRAALGVHTLGQIIAGWALAMLIVIIFYLCKQSLYKFVSSSNPITVLLASVVLSSAFLLYYLKVITRLASEFVVPAQWQNSHNNQLARLNPDINLADQSHQLVLFNADYVLLVALFIGICITIALRSTKPLSTYQQQNTSLKNRLAVALFVLAYCVLSAALVVWLKAYPSVTFALLLVLPPVVILGPVLIDRHIKGNA